MAFCMRKHYVEQPKGFEDPHFPDHVYKLNKALYGLKQAPRVWYEGLTNFLVDKGYKRGGVDKTLFIKHFHLGIMIAKIYVDDIIFGSTSPSKVQEFVNHIKQEFEMSMVGELNIFLGLEVNQSEGGIFISQTKYANNLVKRFGLETTKYIKNPMSTTLKLKHSHLFFIYN